MKHFLIHTLMFIHGPVCSFMIKTHWNYLLWLSRHNGGSNKGPSYTFQYHSAMMCWRIFRGTLVMPRDVILSDSYTSDRCYFCSLNEKRITMNFISGYGLKHWCGTSILLLNFFSTLFNLSYDLSSNLWAFPRERHDSSLLWFLLNNW